MVPIGGHEGVGTPRTGLPVGVFLRLELGLHVLLRRRNRIVAPEIHASPLANITVIKARMRAIGYSLTTVDVRRLVG
jgi:hypothetical protein